MGRGDTRASAALRLRRLGAAVVEAVVVVEVAMLEGVPIMQVAAMGDGCVRLGSVGTLGVVAPDDSGVNAGRSWLRSSDREGELPGDGSSEPEASGEGAWCAQEGGRGGEGDVDVGRRSSNKMAAVKSKYSWLGGEVVAVVASKEDVEVVGVEVEAEAGVKAEAEGAQAEAEAEAEAEAGLSRDLSSSASSNRVKSKPKKVLSEQ